MTRPHRRLLLALPLLVAVLPAPAPGAAAAGPAAPPADVAWVREGFAEARALTAVDLDADGDEEVVYGGRGVAVVDAGTARTGRPLRTVRPVPEDPGNVLDGGDNAWTTGVSPVAATGDPTPDLLVTTSDTDAYLVDGATGRHVWHAPRTGSGLSFGFGLVDVPGDGVPDLFPTGGKVAVDGATGAVAWTAPIAKNARHVVSAELDGRPGRDVLVAHDPVGPADLTAASVYALSGDGRLLWSFGAVTVVHDLAAADLDGDGTDEAVYAGHQGAVVAVGATGLRWAAPVGASPVVAVAAGDTDGDGRDEVYASAATGEADPSVVALGPEGAARWRHPVARPATVLEPRRGTLLVGTGLGDRDPGAVLALDPAPLALQRQRWTVPTDGQVRAVTVARSGGRDLVALGGDDAVLRVVDLATGAPVWRWTSGDFLRAADAGDTDGDGRAEVATADDRGHVMLVEDDGTVRWSATPSPGRSSATGVAVLRGSGPAVAAVATRYAPTDRSSTVAAWDADGAPRWSTPVPGSAESLVAAELTGDGADDVLVGEAPSLHPEGDGCHVSAYDGRTGTRLWRTRVSAGCLSVQLAADPDAGPIAYGDLALFSSPRVAVLERSGAVRWALDTSESSAWVALSGDSVVAGGFASDARGHVTARRASDGARTWRTYFGTGRGPDGRVAAAGPSRYGTVVDDLDGDGRDEVLTSSDDGTVALLDGRGGAVRWATEVESPETLVTQRHSSGPVALVDRPGRGPAVVTAQFATGQPIRGRGFVLGLDGTLERAVELRREARDVVPLLLPGGRPGAALAAGYSLTVLAP